MTPEEQLALIKQQLAEAPRRLWDSLRGFREPEPSADFLDQMRSRRERLERSALRNWLIAVLVALSFPAFLIVVPYRGYTEPVTLVIESGMGRRAIAARLSEQGVLVSRWPFLLFSGLQPWKTLKAGEYRFDRAQSTASVFSTLARGSVYLHPLTVPEGWTRWEIADEVARRRLAERDAFLEATEEVSLISDLAPEAASLEGFLFPDTYRFPRPTDARTIVRAMVRRFREVYEELSSTGANETRPVQEIVTLASLVEEETGSKDERALIAGVYSNRLRRGMPLQCDPTVIYAARLAFDGVFDGVINQSDLERNSPYNTYLHRGLPPGPIASPGRAALAAALFPAPTDYLFFVSNTEGGHYFAASGAEHARNVARYRQLRAEKQQ